MAGLYDYEPDVGTAYYRSNDPIKNLRIRVNLRRVTSSTLIQQHVSGEDDSGNVEMAKLNEVAKQDQDSKIFRWQEKVFSQREIELYSNPENCFNVPEKKYNEEVTAIIGKGRPTNRLFSYVDHDPYSFQDETLQFMTTSPKEKPSVLAEKMAHVRRRRVGGRQLKDKEVGIIPKINIVEMRPTDDFINKNHIEAPPIQVMYIMADLSPRESYCSFEKKMCHSFKSTQISQEAKKFDIETVVDLCVLNTVQKASTEDDEYVLCCLQVNANGVLCIRPDFNRGRRPYIVETSNLSRDVFEYTLDHVSKEMSRLEQDKELKMYREVYSRHREFLGACVGHEFEMLQADVLRLVVYGEIVSAQGFDLNNLYLHFFVDLPKNWYAEPQEQLAWVTQTCATKTIDRDEVAYFSFPFHFELCYKRNPGSTTDPSELPRFPLLLLEVLSVDSWHRFYHEGYAYIQLPSKPGVHTSTQHCWRPVGSSLTSKLRRFFIGGTPELEDPTYMAVPSTFEGSHMSKYGFTTETVGSVTTRLNIIMQSRTFMENKAKKQTVGSLLDNLGITAMQANITNVLDAFKRARMKMMQAREAATRELLKDIEKRK